MHRLLRREPVYPRQIRLRADAAGDPAAPAQKSSYRLLFQRGHRRATILASVPWFLQDLATYGIGIFTPTILADAFGHQSGPARNVADLVSGDVLAAKGAAAIDVLLIVGIVAAVFLTDAVGRIRLQIFGFVGCAAGLLIASLSLDEAGGTSTALVFAGFVLFSFMTNLGPNAQTYLLSGEVFPTALRGRALASRRRSPRSARRPRRSCSRSCWPTSAPQPCSTSSPAPRGWAPWSLGCSGSRPKA